ncbi:MAG: NAD-dependent epimerase/dehydratase family protein [Candidatus Hydrogenedentes bacterium]|nr:NAD-dependent epimerase/dehydratase family protein [Candidatus Hydrogenedentota bacterium]
MTTALVTGGAGFIGSHLVDALVSAGHRVVVVDNLSTGKTRNLNSSAVFHRMDIRDDALSGVFEAEQPEVVFHLAAQMDVRRSVLEPVFDAEINILGAIKLLELAVKHRVRKFIFSSTGGAIYGEPESLPASEACPPRPKCPYGASKLAFEHYLRLYHDLHALPFTILRFPNVYGPRQSPEGEAGVCSILIGLMLRGVSPTLYGFGEPLRDYVYVGDIVRGCLLSLDRGDSETINLGSERGASVNELFAILSDLIGFRGEAKREPLRAGEVAQIYTTGERARALLGWAPEVDLRTGLAHTLAYIREH